MEEGWLDGGQEERMMRGRKDAVRESLYQEVVFGTHYGLT